MADDDGWIVWHGRERPPVGHNVEVYFQIRAGDRDRAIGKGAVAAGKLRWTHKDDPGDIVAYKRK